MAEYTNIIQIWLYQQYQEKTPIPRVLIPEIPRSVLITYWKRHGIFQRGSIEKEWVAMRRLRFRNSEIIAKLRYRFPDHRLITPLPTPIIYSSRGRSGGNIQFYSGSFPYDLAKQPC